MRGAEAGAIAVLRTPTLRRNRKRVQ